MAHVYDDNFNMDREIEWVSDTSDYESDREIPSLPNGNSPIIWEVIKRSADRNFNGNVLDAYIAFVLSYRSFKKDADHQKIMMSRYQKGPYIKIARESAVKHKDTVLAEINIFNEFEEQKCSLDNDFKDIEDLIVTSYLKKKHPYPAQ